jgi:hypothetical protein
MHRLQKVTALVNKITVIGFLVGCKLQLIVIVIARSSLPMGVAPTPSPPGPYYKFHDYLIRNNPKQHDH